MQWGISARVTLGQDDTISTIVLFSHDEDVLAVVLHGQDSGHFEDIFAIVVHLHNEVVFAVLVLGHDADVFVVVVHLHDEVVSSVVILGHNEAVSPAKTDGGGLGLEFQP